MYLLQVYVSAMNPMHKSMLIFTAITVVDISNRTVATLEELKNSETRLVIVETKLFFTNFGFCSSHFRSCQWLNIIGVENQKLWKFNRPSARVVTLWHKLRSQPSRSYGHVAGLQDFYCAFFWIKWAWRPHLMLLEAYQSKKALD